MFVVSIVSQGASLAVVREQLQQEIADHHISLEFAKKFRVFVASYGSVYGADL